jgi:hypothetical protein
MAKIGRHDLDLNLPEPCNFTPLGEEYQDGILFVYSHDPIVWKLAPSATNL